CRLAFEYCADRAEAARKPAEVVAAFGDRHHTAAAVLISYGGDGSGQPRKLVDAEAHPRKRIVIKRIEAGRDEKQLRPKLTKDGECDRVVRKLEVLVHPPGPPRQGRGE